jgi:predicted MFS family arabinose efflux permease
MLPVKPTGFFDDFDASRAIAGWCGSVVYVFFDRQTSPWTIAGSMVTGVFMANFLGEAAGRYLGGIVGERGSDFVVGLCGVVVLPAIMAAAKKWRPDNGSSKL